MSVISKPMRELVGRIAASYPHGSRLQFAVVGRAPSLQQRVAASSDAQELIQVARDERMLTGVPFWQALFFNGASGEEGVPAEILDAAFYHQKPAVSDELSLQIGGDLSYTLEAFALGLGDDEVLMLTSRVTLADGAQMHIPMLDFSLKARLQGADVTVRRAGKALGVPGELSSTGRSYHFFGLQGMGEEAWRNFMARALLLAPITDERWIAHQLIAGYAGLRVSASDKGAAPVPIGTV